MTMALYCKKQGMTLDQFLSYQGKVKGLAEKVVNYLKNNELADTGCYLDTKFVLSEAGYTELLYDHETIEYVLAEAKKSGVESFENGNYLRI